MSHIGLGIRSPASEAAARIHSRTAWGRESCCATSTSVVEVAVVVVAVAAVRTYSRNKKKKLKIAVRLTLGWVAMVSVVVAVDSAVQSICFERVMMAHWRTKR